MTCTNIHIHIYISYSRKNVIVCNTVRSLGGLERNVAVVSAGSKHASVTQDLLTLGSSE